MRDGAGGRGGGRRDTGTAGSETASPERRRPRHSHAAPQGFLWGRAGSGTFAAHAAPQQCPRGREQRGAEFSLAGVARSCLEAEAGLAGAAGAAVPTQPPPSRPSAFSAGSTTAQPYHSLVPPWGAAATTPLPSELTEHLQPSHTGRDLEGDRLERLPGAGRCRCKSRRCRRGQVRPAPQQAETPPPCQARQAARACWGCSRAPVRGGHAGTSPLPSWPWQQGSSRPSHIFSCRRTGWRAGRHCPAAGSHGEKE